MRFAIVVLVFIASIANASSSPSFEEIKAMPSSYAKDYYTWRFINESSASKSQAREAYLWTKRKNQKLKKAIRKKLGYVPKKLKIPTKLPNSNNYIIHPSTAAKKSLNELKKLQRKIKKRGQYSDVLDVMATDKAFINLTQKPASIFCYIFNNVGSKYRKNHFNYALKPKLLEQLLHQKQFNTTVQKIVTTPKLDKSKKSLVFMISDNNLSFQSNFLLAMNALEFKHEKVGKNFLKIARTKTHYQSKFDQVDFWLYLLTKDKDYLKQLEQSHDINLYTLRARDILKKPYPKVISPEPPFRVIEDFDIVNPIHWEEIKLEIKNNPEKLAQLAEKYHSSDTLGVYSYIKERETKYKKPYYPMPYPLAMWGFSRERTAILYALARQESRFIPASVSPSYALGMMQVMPFLIKHLAKERGQKIDLNEMFNPYVAVNYANQHLDYLTKWVYHPLFIAYAYNGGIGFTKRTIKSNHMFKSGKYEPYLSMELVDYAESREYGKKVLTNYVIYMNLLGSQIKVSPLLNSLKHPSQTDRFRK